MGSQPLYEPIPTVNWTLREKLQWNLIQNTILTKENDDVIKWKHFPCYWPFVQWIHQSPVNSPHKGQWCGALMFSLICCLNKQLSKQWWDWWFEMPPCSLWHHCNGKMLWKWHLLKCLAIMSWPQCNNSFLSSDAIWWHGYESILIH